MIPGGEPKATFDLLVSIPEERIPGIFSPPRRERPTRRGESSLVTKTGVPLKNALRNALCGDQVGRGEVIANAALCRKKG